MSFSNFYNNNNIGTGTLFLQRTNEFKLKYQKNQDIKDNNRRILQYRDTENISYNIISDSLFLNNTVSKNGGAIYIKNSELNINNVIFDKNNA